MTIWILVFIGMFFLDFVWARYVVAMQADSAFHASNWAVFITIISGILNVSYVKDPWLLVPAAVGAWLGTYASKWWHKAHEPPSKPSSSRRKRCTSWRNEPGRHRVGACGHFGTRRPI